MTPAPQPIAALGDTLSLVAAVLALKYLLCARALRRAQRGERAAVAQWGSVWFGRIAAVAVILPALRLFSLAVEVPGIAVPLIGVGCTILLAGVGLLLLDRVIMALLRRWIESTR